MPLEPSLHLRVLMGSISSPQACLDHRSRRVILSRQRRILRRAAGSSQITRRWARVRSSAVNARRTPKRVLLAHSPDQCPQLLADRRPASQRAGLPAPVAAKPGTVPPHQRLGPDNQHCLEDRREPTIELDEEQAVVVTESDATAQLAPQHNQLLPERGIFGFKSALRLDECRQQLEGQEDQRDHHRKRDVIPSSVQCGRGFRYTQDLSSRSRNSDENDP